MKKILLVFAILFTGLLYSQTGTTFSAKIKMNSPVAGTVHDSCVVWNGTDKQLKFIPFSDALAGFGASQDLQSVTNVGSTTTNLIQSSVGFSFASGSGNSASIINGGIYLNTSGNGFADVILKSDNLTTQRTQQFQDKDGTFAYLDDIPSSSGTVTNVTATSPIHVTGVSTATPNIEVDKSAADNTTFGVSTYLPADFNASSGAISLDYSNGQKATTSLPGFLSTTDWNTFNGKQAALGFTPENVANKITSSLTTSTTDYPASSLVKSVTDANTTAIALKAPIASPTFTGTVTVPNGSVLGTPASVNLANATFPTLNQNTSGTAANLSGTPALPNGTTATTQTADDNSTKLATTAYVYTKKDKSMDALVLSGKTIVAFGDSYTISVGATNTGRGYISYLANGLGCNLSNNAVQGTTIMKRTPVNYINSPNMVDNMTNIPTYSESTHAFLMFEFGLNDMGQNGANYTAANLITDYQTILTYANGTKGWPFNKILILGAPYANSTGYAAYAALSGNSAPTTQHHLDIIEAERQVAQTNQTMFIDLYAAQVKNGVSTTMSADGYHPNDPGHYGLAKIIANSLGLGATFISRVPVSSSTPAILVNGGASYSVTLGEQANINTIVYNDGVNKAGFGPSTNTLEYHIYSGGKHNFYVNNVLLESIKTTGPETTLTTTTGGLKVGYVAKTANYTVGTNDHTINCTANSFTVTLLSAVTVGAGKIYTINNSGSGTITTATTSSQTIDGTTPPSLTQNHNITVESDGANWIILSQK